MAPKDSDDALLARLNALRQSNVTLDKTPKLTSDNGDASSELASTTDDVTKSTPHNDEDDKILDELLNDIGAQGDWDLNQHEERDVKQLAADVRTVLPFVSNHPTSRPGDTENPKNTELSDMFKSDANRQQLSDEQEAQEVIAKMIAELEYERAHGGGDDDEEDNEADPDSKEAENSDEAPSLELPSAPSNVPIPAPADGHADVEAALAARFSGLSLPAAPSFSPTKKPVKVTKSLPKYTDEDIDSWCVICNDDAQVRCIGCDGDLYCRSCWSEGHTGPDAGFDEKKHRWTKYESKKDESST